MSLQLGPHRLDAIETGTYALDGGAMFGVVPRPLWERKLAPDEKNRVALALRCLLVRTGERVILVDTGAGGKWSEKERAIYAVDHAERTLEGELARLGLAPADVTDVILTHLHFDHAGGATRRDPHGRIVPAFPRATYHVQRANWEWAASPSERDRGSYRDENFRALDDADCLHLVEGDTELFPGVFLLPSNGHTIGMQLVRVQDGETWLTYCADLVPTSAHLKPAWHAAYDLQPLVVIEEKKMLLAEALEDNGILYFEHDPRMQACRVREEGGELVVAEAVSL